MFRKLMERDNLTMTNRVQKDQEAGGPYGIRQWASGIVLDSSTLGKVEGFKKLARACSKSLGQWNSGMVTKNMPPEVPPRYSEISLGRPCSDRASQRSMGRSSELTGSCNVSLNYASVNRLRNGDSRDSPSNRGYLTERSVRHCSSESNIAEIRRDDKPLDTNFRRVVLVKNIPKGVGVTSVLDQVRGGPLEMVDWTFKNGQITVELYFISPEHARSFYRYGTTTGFLVVHGVKLKIEWVSPETSIHPSIVRSPCFNTTFDNNCRRCLILARNVTDNSRSTHFLDPRTHFSHEININSVKEDFSQFGTILEISPVISRVISLCLQYASVRSAVMAKKCCEQDGTTLNHKYKNWTLMYGKDPTDLPCIHP